MALTWALCAAPGRRRRPLPCWASPLPPDHGGWHDRRPSGGQDARLLLQGRLQAGSNPLTPNPPVARAARTLKSHQPSLIAQSTHTHTHHRPGPPQCLSHRGWRRPQPRMSPARFF